MLDWYRQLIELRRSRPVARDAEDTATDAWYDSTRSLLAYAHADLLVCCNLGAGTVEVPEALGATLLLSSCAVVPAETTPVLPPDSVAIWARGAVPKLS